MQFSLDGRRGVKLRRGAVRLPSDVEDTNHTPSRKCSRFSTRSSASSGQAGARHRQFGSLTLSLPRPWRKRKGSGAPEGASEQTHDSPNAGGAVPRMTQTPLFGTVLPGPSCLLLRRHSSIAASGWGSNSAFSHLEQSLAALSAAAIIGTRQRWEYAMDSTSQVAWSFVEGFIRGTSEARLLHGSSIQHKVERKMIKENEKAARGKKTALKLLAGGLAGAVSKTVVAPLERLTTIMMADMSSIGFRKSFMLMWKDGGFIGLWSGNAATLAKIFPQTAIQFAAFHSIKDVAARQVGDRRLTNLELLMIGSMAGLMACSATYPLDTMRTQMSITGGLRGNLFSVGNQIVQKQGVGGLYKGFAATLTSDVLGSGLGFMNYEIGTRIYREMNDGRAPNSFEKGIIGALSATATLTLIMPLEVVRRRLQVQGSCGRPVLYKGTLDAFIKIWQSGGIRAFYGAALSNYLKVAPSIGSVYFLYDFFSEKLGVESK